MSSRQDSEPTSIIVLNSPGLRPWRKRQLNGETQKLAFGLQLRLAKGITKVVVQTHMHDSPLSSTGQGCNQNFLLRLLAPQDRSFRSNVGTAQTELATPSCKVAKCWDRKLNLLPSPFQAPPLQKKEASLRNAKKLCSWTPTPPGGEKISRRREQKYDMHDSSMSAVWRA